jgi:VWFA-related protein
MRREKTVFRALVLAPFAAGLLLVSLMLPARSWCQGAPAGPIQLRPGTKPEKLPTPEEQKHRIRVRVNEVTTPVTVRDSTGEMILDLAQANFHVYDNGVEQAIDHFDLGGDPLSIVLVAETSSHIEALLPAVRKTGIIFTETVMGQTAEAAVVGFDDSVELLEKFTTDSDSVQDTINHLRMGTSGVRLYDAMARGISLLEQRPSVRRRILVVVAEAQDTGSENKLGEVLRQAQLANVAIYSIGLSTTAAELRAPPRQYQGPEIGPPGTYPVPTPNGQPQTPQLEQEMQGNMDVLALIMWLVKTGKNALGPNSLNIASNATGGLHMNTMKDRTIEKALDEIGGELHAQYTLSYRPPSDEPSGYHEIKITVDRPGVKVRNRPGYYIPPPES